MATPNDNQLSIPRAAFDWYDEYAHGRIDRRTFVARLSTLAGAGLGLGVLLQALTPNYALAEQVSFNDPDILASYATLAAPEGHGEVRGYLVQPRGPAGPWPSVLVVHENRGLNPYIKDVARRLAKAGYLAFAPDALHSVGGYPGNDDQGRLLQSALDRADIEQDFIAAASWLKGHERSTGKLGAVGFCFGGYIVNLLAATMPAALNAAVPFYGTPAAAPLQAAVRGPLLVQLAENDERVNASWPAYEKQLQANRADFEMRMYPDANHGFHNDSTGRYNAGQAELAWQRTLAFFSKHLS